MTFEMDDEKIPEYKPPNSDDENELPGTSQDGANDAAGEACTVDHCHPMMPSEIPSCHMANNIDGAAHSHWAGMVTTRLEHRA
jgi:hypothetical protein